MIAQSYEYTKNIELYSLNEWNVWFMNYISKSCSKKWLDIVGLPEWPSEDLTKSSRPKIMIKLDKLSKSTISEPWKLTKSIQHIEKCLYKKSCWTAARTAGSVVFWLGAAPMSLLPRCSNLEDQRTGSLMVAERADPIWSCTEKPHAQ